MLMQDCAAANGDRGQIGRVVEHKSLAVTAMVLSSNGQEAPSDVLIAPRL